MYLRIAILTFALLSPITAWTKIVIKGKILGYDGKSIVFYHPTIEGIYTPYWKEVKPEGNGTFRIEFENKGYGNTKVSYKNTRYRFFHDTNSQIYFEIREIQDGKKRSIPGEKFFVLADSLKQAITVKIAGDYEAINKFYNRNLRSSYATTQSVEGNYYSKLFRNSDDPSSALALLDSLQQIEITQINRLPKTIGPENPAAEKKEKEIRDFLANEVHAFYGAIFLNGMFLKRKDHIIRTTIDSTSNPNLYNHDWELLVERLAEQARLSLAPAPNSPDYIDFIESMAYALVNYREYKFPQDPTTSLDEIVINRLFKYDTTLFRDKATRFAYELNGVQLYLSDQLFYSPELLHAIYDLQAKHPTSAHFEFYQRKIEKLRKNLETSSQDFQNARIIQANYSSFESLVKRFEGKNILIDIWATWCHPCIEEFKHKALFQPFIDSEKIEMLYISIDKPQWKDRWKRSIRINQLHGNHFRADRKFIEDMWVAIGDFKGAIPRYVLIDKRGRIFKSTAARPSEGGELIQQIELLIAPKN